MYSFRYEDRSSKITEWWDLVSQWKLLDQVDFRYILRSIDIFIFITPNTYLCIAIVVYLWKLMKKIIIPGPHKKKQATGDAEDLKEEERFSQVDQRVERIKQTQREM